MNKVDWKLVLTVINTVMSVAIMATLIVKL